MRQRSGRSRSAPGPPNPVRSPAMIVTVTVLIQQKDPAGSAFVVVPANAVAAWGLTRTPTVEGTLDGAPIGRRSLVHWDEQRWFIELRRELTVSIGRGVGDLATLTIHPASTELPTELCEVIEADPGAALRWEAASAAQQRMIREDILGAKTSAARRRRAEKALAPCERPPKPAVKLAGAGPRPLLLRVVGSDLPGLVCEPYRDVHVGMVERTRGEPEVLVPANRPQVTWNTRIELREGAGQAAFRGPAVSGPPHETFVYLTWVGRLDGAHPAMFRRAKLRLDKIPPEVLAAALLSGGLLCEVGLTDPPGMPLCGSVRPPIVQWRALNLEELGDPD